MPDNNRKKFGLHPIITRMCYITFVMTVQNDLMRGRVNLTQQGSEDCMVPKGIAD